MAEFRLDESLIGRKVRVNSQALLDGSIVGLKEVEEVTHVISNHMVKLGNKWWVYAREDGVYWPEKVKVGEWLPAEEAGEVKEGGAPMGEEQGREGLLKFRHHCWINARAGQEGKGTVVGFSHEHYDNGAVLLEPPHSMELVDGDPPQLLSVGDEIDVMVVEGDYCWARVVRRAQEDELQAPVVDELETDKGESLMAGTSKYAKAGKVEREGDRIVATGMSIKETIAALVRIEEQDNLVVAVNYEFAELFFTEALFAFMAALKERHGDFFASPTPGMFGPTPPTLLGIETGPGEVSQAIWGGFELPGMKGQFQTQLGWREESPILTLTGKIRQRDKGELEALIEDTKRIAKAQSIYRGKALELRFPDPVETPNPLDHAPKFMVFGDQEPPVFNREIQSVIDNYIYEDIEATRLTKLNNMPIKKGIMLEGPPGVGKTLLAHTLAKKCVENGWTFCYIKNVDDLAKAVHLVRNRWEPVMVFAEDLDRVVGKERTDAVNEVLNVIDGVDSKSNDIVILVTTNEIDGIHKTMLRPGRLDVLISVTAPDAGTVEQLIRREAGSTLSIHEDLGVVGEELAGTMPAVVVQVVQRAKRAAQRRTRLAKGPGLPTQAYLDPEVQAADLLIAAKSMKQHIERLRVVESDERTPLEKAADSLAAAMREQTEVLALAGGYDPAFGNGGGKRGKKALEAYGGKGGGKE